MDDKLKTLNKLSKNNLSLFNELFGIGKKVSSAASAVVASAPKSKYDAGLLYSDDFIEIASNYNVKFKKTGSMIRKPLSGYSNFTRLNWDDGDLNWMLKSDFVAEMVQMSDGVVSRFIEGEWFGGEFRGDRFISSTFGVPNRTESTFNGGIFMNSIWNPSPYYFVNGTTNEKNTILGIKNIVSLTQAKFKINIISIVPGKKIVLQMQDGNSHEISVIKRLDENSSNFKYRVKDGESGEVFTQEVKWAVIRSSDEQSFLRMTTLSNSQIPELFTSVFNLNFNTPVVKLIIDDEDSVNNKVVEKPVDTKEETPAELSTKQEKIELSKIPFLGFDKIPRKGGSETEIYFNFATPALKSEFDNVISLLDAGWVYSYIKQIKTAIDNKIITGAPSNYKFLGAVIGFGTQGEFDSKTADKDLTSALNGVESFLKSFVGTMVRRVRKTGNEKGVHDVEDTVGRDLIKNKIKQLIAPSSVTKKSSNPVRSKSPGPVRLAESMSVVDRVKNILYKKM